MLYGPAMRSAWFLLGCLLAACGGRSDGADEPATTPPPITATTPPVATAALSGNVSLVSAGGAVSASALFPLPGADTPAALGAECVRRRLSTSRAEAAGANAGNIVIDVPGKPGA